MTGAGRLRAELATPAGYGNPPLKEFVPFNPAGRCVQMPTARDVMSSPVIMIDGMATVSEAVDVMKKEGVRALIVERRGLEDAYGIVTQRDIAYAVLAQGEDPDEVKVHEIQSKPLVVVNPDLDVKYVARLMSNFGLSRAPVIFDGKVQGIVSVSDLVNKAM